MQDHGGQRHGSVVCARERDGRIQQQRHAANAAGQEEQQCEGDGGGVGRGMAGVYCALGGVVLGGHGKSREGRGEWR